MAYVGARVPRKEDPRLVRGGQYVADLVRPGMLHIAFLRSSHAHARLARVDLSALRAMPGVIGAWAYADLAADLSPIPVRLKPNHPSNLEPGLQMPLAPGEVRYVGEPIALVVATSRYVAEDALELAQVDYEPLRVVTRAAEARPDDFIDAFANGTGDVDKAMAAADVVLRGRFHTNRHAGMMLETRGLVAEYDIGREELTVWGPTKVAHFNRGVLAAMMRLPEAQIRFIELDVGGGFGTRGEFYPEDFLVPYIARRLGRCVRWIEDRREHMVTANHSREQIHEVELAASRDGKVLALRSRMICDQGAYIRTHGVVVPNITADMFLGPYVIDNYQCEVRVLLSNKTPTGTYRGPGRYSAGLIREQMMDRLAARLGLDPVEVRRRNLIQPHQLPYDRKMKDLEMLPIVLDSGDYPGLVTRALERFGYAEARAEQARARAAGRCLGIGIGCFVEKTGHGPWEYARVEMAPSGHVTVYSGGASVGQGMETVLAQICADAVGARYEDVTVRHGDTATVPYGVGSWSSRQTTSGGSAVAQAAAEARQQVLTVAGRLLEARTEDLAVTDSQVQVAGTDRGVSFRDVARAAGPPHGAGVVASAVYRTHNNSYPFGVHLALVEVDRETGKVKVLRYLVAYDIGRAVNPTLVEGQMAGGAAQGIGGMFLEDLVYDENGQLLSGTWMDYLMPTALDVPRIDVLLDEVPSPRNPLGVKGAGEGGLVGVPGALAGAVADAIGVADAVDDLPLTPERVWAACRRGA